MRLSVPRRYPVCHVLLLQDLAILTTDVQRCVYYEQESENVKGRGMCVMPRDFLLHFNQNNNIVVPNTEDECNVRKIITIDI